MAEVDYDDGRWKRTGWTMDDGWANGCAPVRDTLGLGGSAAVHGQHYDNGVVCVPVGRCWQVDSKQLWLRMTGGRAWPEVLACAVALGRSGIG